MVRIVQKAFNAGIMSEGMYARTDTEKFQKGLREALNVVVRPQGGVQNRAGFEAATRFDTSGSAAYQYLIPFSFSTEQTYQIEFSDDVARVIRNGAYVLDSAVGEIAVSAVSSADPAEITLTTPADDANFPDDCLAYLTDPNGDHRLHEAIVRITGSTSGVLSFTVFDGTGLDTTSGDWGTLGAGAKLEKVYEFDHPYDLAHLPMVRFAQDADTMYLAHPLYPPQKLGRTAEDAWSVTPVVFTSSVPRVPVSSPVSVTGATGADPVVVTAPGHGLSNGDGFSIDGVVGFTALNNKVYRASSVTTNTITLLDVNGTPVDGTGETYISGGTISSPGVAYEYGTDVDTGNLERYEYVISALDEEGADEGLPLADPIVVSNDLFFRGSKNSLGWREVAGASRYNVYRKDAGTYGYIGSTTDRTFVDQNITPDTSQGVRLDRNPFDGAGNYPSVVAFYEQRMVYGATVNDPQLVEMSRVSNVENFSATYPEMPDDALRFRLRDTRVNKVHGFASMGSFVIFTSGGEWVLDGQQDGDYVRPDKRKLEPVTTYGAANIEPLHTGSVVLYVEPSREAIRDYRPSHDSTPPGDVTVLARDLFEDRRVVSWAYAAAPDKLVWVALDDGTLLSMTYTPEHDVWGWTRHELGGGGKARQVSVTRENLRDVVYVVVSRTVDGSEVTMTERMAKRTDTDVTRCCFVDGGLTLEADAPASAISGLLHLRGQTVSVLADGDVYQDRVVDETGTVDIGTREAAVFVVGYGYQSVLRTLNVQFDVQGMGSTDGRIKATSEIALSLRRSRGIEAGVDLSRMDRLKEWTASLVGGPIPLRTFTALMTVSGDWVRDATTYVRQRNPLPMTVLSIAPEWELGE